MSKSVGTVSDIKGLVTLDVNGETQELKRRDPISENGALLTTTEFSNISIAFDDGRVVEIGPNQQIALDDTFFENEAFDNDEVSFTEDVVNDVSSNQNYETFDEAYDVSDTYNSEDLTTGEVETEQLDQEYTETEVDSQTTTASAATSAEASARPVQPNLDSEANTENMA